MTSGLSISGAASGLDTASIINSLIQVETNQQTLLKNRITKASDAKDAYTSLLTDSRNLATQARSVANTALWTGVTASSTSANVKATATGTFASELTFDVTALAKTHASVSATTYAGTSASVVAGGAGALRLTKGDGTYVDIARGDGTLATIVANINAAGAGVKASAVQTSTGLYRLQLAATASGAAAKFTLRDDTTAPGTPGEAGTVGGVVMNVISTGADATLSVGDSSPYTITSSSNTFTGLMPGLTVTVSALENDVTVATVTDGSTVATQVDGLVKAANTLLANIAAATKYDPANKTSGPLVGSNAARSLQQSVLSAVSGTAAPGIAVQRDGTLTFDSAAFVTAYNADPTTVAGKFGPRVTFTANPAATTPLTGTATLVRGGDLTAPGTYAVAVTTAADVDSWTLTPDTVTPRTLTLTRGSQTITYTGTGTQAMVDSVNSQAKTLGFGVTATISGGVVTLTADSYGSATSFTTTYTGTAPTHVSTGTNVVGTIDGKTATGTGRVLSLGTGQGAASGLALSVTVTAADLAKVTSGAIGSVAYTTGVAQGLLRVVAAASTTDGGMLTTAASGLDSTMKDLQTQVDVWTTRLADRRAALVKQFTAMELALQKLKSAGSSITAATTQATTN